MFTQRLTLRCRTSYELPHLKAPNQRSDFVLLATCIEIARHRSKAPAIPDELSSAYFAAMQQLRSLIIECLQLKLNDESDATIFLGGLAATSDLPNLGNAILELPLPNVCPNCETDVPPFGYELE